MGNDPNRHIPLEGASNFRDFGGYTTKHGRRIKWRQLFRSDRLSRLTPIDHDTLRPFGIRLICDLRRDSELMRAPTNWVSGQMTDIWHVPLLLDARPTVVTRIMNDPDARKDPGKTRQIMIELNRHLVISPEIHPTYKRLFERLAAKDSNPVLIHCSAGKDRTGIVCALILSALGVERDQVVEDYLLTRQYYWGARDLERAATQIFDYGISDDWNLEALRPIFTVEASYIEAALDEIESRHHTVENFLLKAIGLAPKTLDQLADKLID